MVGSLESPEGYVEGRQLDEKQQAIEACSCPRASGERLATPQCAVDQCVGGSNSILFVKALPGLYCKSAVTYADSHFCTCVNRMHVYLKHGL